MKKIFTFLAIVLFTANIMAQSPEKMSYQAVVRNDQAQLVVNQEMSVQVSILKNSVSGNAVYIETQNITSNSNGLISMEIGMGTVISGSFSEIDWSSDTYFIKTEIDPMGGSNYSIVSTQQLLSVPYALHAKTAETLTSEIVETDPVFNVWDKSTGISVTESQISDLQNYLTSEIDPAFSGWNKTDGIVITENQISDLQDYLLAESDPLFTSWDKHTGILITESQISDLQNYITSEIDPAFSGWDKTDGIVITENQISDLQNYLLEETDPLFTNWDKHSGISVTESQITDLQDYLLEETDPLFNNWDKSSGISVTESQITDLQDYLTTEMDPNFSASVAAGITSVDTASWNSKSTPNLAQVTAINNQANSQIKNVIDPTDPQDAGTKSYIDLMWESLEGRIALLESNVPGTPEIITTKVTKIKRNSAMTGGTVLSDGGSNVISGMCWSTDSIPTVNNSQISIDRMGTGIGTFVSYITNVQPATKYFVRAYAINSSKVSYGEIKEFISADESNIVVYSDDVMDVDGNIYETIVIDTMIWMAENLKTYKLNDGTPIAYVEDTAAWISTTQPAFCWYWQDSSLKDDFGALYNYYALLTDSLCPIGWHVATDEEWLATCYFVGGDEGLNIAGLYLKSQSSLWKDSNGPGLDTYGFNAMPGGWRRSGGTFQLAYNNGRWWAANIAPQGKVRYGLNCCGNHSVSRSFTNDFSYGYSIRCVKNSSSTTE